MAQFLNMLQLFAKDTDRYHFISSGIVLALSSRSTSADELSNTYGKECVMPHITPYSDDYETPATSHLDNHLALLRMFNCCVYYFIIRVETSKFVPYPRLSRR